MKVAKRTVVSRSASGEADGEMVAHQDEGGRLGAFGLAAFDGAGLLGQFFGVFTPGVPLRTELPAVP